MMEQQSAWTSPLLPIADNKVKHHTTIHTVGRPLISFSHLVANNPTPGTPVLFLATSVKDAKHVTHINTVKFSDYSLYQVEEADILR